MVTTVTIERSPARREWGVVPLALSRASPANVLVHSPTVPAGGLLTFSAAGFQPDVELRVMLDYREEVIGTVALDSSGNSSEFSRLAIPIRTRPGRHVLTFVDGSQTFDLLIHVIASTVAVAVDPPRAAAGGRVRFVGRGFAADLEVHVKFDEGGEPRLFGTNSVGSISGAVTVPADAAPGVHELWFLARPAISIAIPVRVDP